MNDSQPVIIGVAQAMQRPESTESGLIHAAGPSELLTEAIRQAISDCGANARLMDMVDMVGVSTTVNFRYPNLSRQVGEAIGCGSESIDFVQARHGGDGPMRLLFEAASAVSNGVARAAIVGGVECGASDYLAKKSGLPLDWLARDDLPGPRMVGYEGDVRGPIERDRELILPIEYYPIFESAIRAARGETVAQMRQRVGVLWSRLSEVATENPYAWDTELHSSDAIITPSRSNRMVGFPYTRLCCSNDRVDQAAALVVVTARTARELGVEPECQIKIGPGAISHDRWSVCERNDLGRSPAMAANAAAVLGAAQISIADVKFVDLYSCFPSAVHMGADALGLDYTTQAMDLSLTGGLSFAGGPWNNYAFHSLATAVTRLREEPGERAFVTANGGMATKHAAVLLGWGAFKVIDAQPDVDTQPSRQVAIEFAGPGLVEAFTVMHDADGPQKAFVYLRVDGGARTLATSTDLDVMNRLEADDEVLGSSANVANKRLQF